MPAPGPRQKPWTPHSRANRGRGGAAPARVTLPQAGCSLPAPDMPAGRQWGDHERAMWAELWASGQATQWSDGDIYTVAMYVRVVCDALTGRVTAGLAQEARHYANSLGLSPEGMKSLGWEMEHVDMVTGVLPDAPASVSPIDERRARLTA